WGLHIPWSAYLTILRMVGHGRTTSFVRHSTACQRKMAQVRLPGGRSRNFFRHLRCRLEQLIAVYAGVP
ncbi:unnamed protein product, partial [Ectocarpus sp. 6 AP-2014]